MNILVLTTRNIYGDSGEKTLMLAKDKELRKHSVNMFYYSFRRIFIEDDGLFNVIHKQSMYAILYQKKFIKSNLEKYIIEYNINALVVSGNWILFLTDILKEIKTTHNILISYDYQGAIEEIKEYKLFKNNKILSNFLYKKLFKSEKKFLEIIDGIEAVSLNAISHLKKYNTKNNYKFVLVHCGIEYPISLKNYNLFRKEWRKKYNLNSDDIACVYAGGIAKWQNVDEIINQAIQNKKIKLFIYTSKTNQKLLKNKFHIPSNIYFDFLSHEKLQYALCAFDFGYLLRNKDITNFVAFPNKYSDYINARLKIIVKNIEIGYYPKDLEKQKFILNVKDKLIVDNNKNNLLYDEYIHELSYNHMIKRLVNYYKTKEN